MIQDDRKVAVVTGTSGQLGPVWVETLALDMGYEVFGINQPPYDVGKKESVLLAAANCFRHDGIPEVLVLNAAIDNPPGSAATFHGNAANILQVNLMGALYTVEAFLPAMIERGKGTIIAIGSIQGFIGADWRNYAGNFEKPIGYNLSKAALMQYVRSLTVQYGRHGIRACCIAFGPYDGGKIPKEFLDNFLKNVPMGRAVSRESLKAAMRFAVECPEFAGQTVLVDGGYVAL
jgi:NAD(P)-dependent dehydrogenase (short-subunit alcohol dehydrogenase family)